jgi:hypothetical protein
MRGDWRSPRRFAPRDDGGNADSRQRRSSGALGACESSGTCAPISVVPHARPAPSLRARAHLRHCECAPSSVIASAARQSQTAKVLGSSDRRSPRRYAPRDDGGDADSRQRRRSGALQCFRILGHMRAHLRHCAWAPISVNAHARPSPSLRIRGHLRHRERSEAISSRESVGFKRPEIATSLRSSR